MANVKTSMNDADVLEFINGTQHSQRKADSLLLYPLIRDLTGKEPKMWGNSIIGYGNYHYKYRSGREGNWFLTGFSPRKQSMTIYIMPGFDRYQGLLSKLGKHKTSKSCLYVNKLSDINLEVLKELITKSVEHMDEKYNR